MAPHAYPPALEKILRDLLVAYRRWNRLRSVRDEMPFPPFPSGVSETDVESAHAELQAVGMALREWFGAQDPAVRNHWKRVLGIKR